MEQDWCVKFKLSDGKLKVSMAHKKPTCELLSVCKGYQIKMKEVIL